MYDPMMARSAALRGSCARYPRLLTLQSLSVPLPKGRVDGRDHRVLAQEVRAQAQRKKDWIAAKELNVSYYNRDMPKNAVSQFWQLNLSSLTARDVSTNAVQHENARIASLQDSIKTNQACSICFFRRPTIMPQQRSTPPMHNTGLA